jgi:uncharacterized protein YhjY with autotransporter beta-barrel domain
MGTLIIRPAAGLWLGLGLLLCALFLSGAASAQTAASFTATGSFNQATTISLTTLENENPNIAFTQAPPFVTVQSGTSAGGTASAASDGSILYHPANNFSGNDSFTYTIETSQGTQTGSGTITVSIATPAAPVAGSTTANIPFTTATTINVGQHDSGLITATQIVQQPFEGTAIVTAVGMITYTPVAFVGTDTMTYRVSGPGGTSNTATITLIVQDPDASSQAVAGAVAATTSENHPVTINVTNSATGGPFTATALASQPNNGFVTSSGLNFVYTPNTSFFGTDSFTYTVTNNSGTSAPATVTVTVSQPVPTAVNQAFATPVNTPVTINVTANDNGGPFTAVAVATAPSHGTATVNGLNIVYTPAHNFFGTDSLTYTVTNASGTSTPGTLTVSVPGAAPLPVGANLTASTTTNHAVTVDASAGATNGPFTAAAVAALPKNGTVTVAGTLFTYTPAPNFSGTDNFTYTLTNSFGVSAPANITITVSPLPLAQAISVTTPANTSVAIDPTKGATGGPFTAAALASTPKNGTATVSGLSITYTPANGFTGTDSFTYTLANAFGTSAPATITVTVAPLPAPPSISVTTAVNTPVTIDPTKGVAGGPFSATAITSPPRNGTATVNGLIITYTPANNFAGTDTFAFTLTNNAGTSTPAIVSVTVNRLPAPLAASATTAANTAVTIDLTKGATGGPFTAAAIVTPPPASAGTAVLHGFSLTFTPNPTFAGTTTLAFTLSNANGTSPPAILTIVVAARPNPATDPTVTALVDSQMEAARRFSSTQISNFNRRFDELHAGMHGFSFSGLGVSSPTQAPSSDTSANRPTGIGSNTDGQTAAAPGTPPPPVRGGGASADSEDALPDRLGIFVNGLVNFGSRGSTASTTGFDFSTSGVSAGVDYRFSDDFILGIGGGYSGDTDNIGTDGSRSNATALNATIYGSYQATDKLYIDGIINYGSLGFDSRRLAGLTSQFTTSHRAGDNVYGALTAGYEMNDGALDIAPYVRLNISSATLNRFTESGGGIGALAFNAQSFDDISTVLGLRGEYAWSLEDAILSPHFRLEYQHEFAGSGQTSVLFADQPNSAAFGLPGDPVERNYFTVGIGANYLMENALSFFVDYEALLGYTNETSHTITFGVSKRF